MKLNKVVLVSVFITAVLLVVVGAVTSVTAANRMAAQREDTYRQLIQQANDQIDQANAQLEALQGQSPVQAAGRTQPTSAQPALQVSVSTAQAEQIAAKVADPAQSLQKSPELVAYEGKPAYEVTFSGGAIYVDASSGEVLFNGTVPQTITIEKAAKVASDYLNGKPVLQADKINMNGKPLYRVIFKDGTIAYLDMTGQILFINPPQPALSVQQISADNSGSSSSPSRSSSPSHEDDHADDD